jgi:hypothetical protein
MLKKKRNGYYIEIGANEPISISNTYKLEKEYGWKGIMVEYESKYLPLYRIYRQNSIPIINDARNVNYVDELQKAKFPKNIDYLQIDLEVDNRSTLDVLLKFNDTVFNEYKFATVTFEHDIYRGDYFNTRAISRAIFESRGYVRIFSDIMTTVDTDIPFEDWYVHPDLVDMNYVNYVKKDGSIHFHEAMHRMTSYFDKFKENKIPINTNSYRRGIFYNCKQEKSIELNKIGLDMYRTLNASPFYHLDYTEDTTFNSDYDFCIMNYDIHANNWIRKEMLNQFKGQTYCILTKTSDDNPLALSPKYFNHYLLLDSTEKQVEYIHPILSPPYSDSQSDTIRKKFETILLH